MNQKCCICNFSRLDVNLHRFPTDEKRLDKWLKSINRDDLKSLSSVQIAKRFVCHKHFEKRFFTPTSRLVVRAYPSLFTKDEILSGRPSQGVGENYYCPTKEDSYNRKRHYDHTHSQEPLNEIQPTASNSSEFPEQSSPHCTQTSQNSELIASSFHDLQSLPQVPPNLPTSQDSEIQATAFTSRDFPEQCLPEYIQSSQDSEVIASSSCDFQTLPQVPHYLPTTQSSQGSEFIASSLCETQQKVLDETLPQVTQNLPANPDSETQAMTYTSRDFSEQCLLEYTQSNSEIQATAFISREFSEQCLPEYSQSSQDSEIIASSLCETNQKDLVETLPQFTQNLPTTPDSEIQATAFTSREFSEQCLPEYTQISHDSEVIASSLCETNQKVLVETLPQSTQNLPANPDSEIQATAFTFSEFPEQYFLECTQNSQESEREMINTDDQSIDAGFLFKVSDVEACRICLATDVKLFSLQDTLLGNCMKSIAGFSTSSCGGLPNFVCYECAPILLKCAKLIEKSKTAEATLLSIIAKNGLITKTLIEQEKTSQADLKSSLGSYLLLNFYIKNDDDNRTSEYIQTESDHHTQMESENVGIEHEVGTNGIAETAEEDDISVIEVEAEIPIVEVESSDGEANEEYISLVPHRTNEELEKCAKEICSECQRKPTRTNLWKRIPLYEQQEFQDIPQYFTTVKIPINEQKQAWRDNMIMKCIETGRAFICCVCQTTFQTEASLIAHSQNHTSNRGGVMCDVCLVSFPCKTVMWHHTERTHAYRFNCKYCRMVLYNIDDAKYHKNFVCNESEIKRSRRLEPIS